VHYRWINFRGLLFSVVFFFQFSLSKLFSSTIILFEAQSSLLDPVMLRLYFIRLCVLLLFAVLVASMQVPPLAGNSRAYLAAV